jgi:hypothetical protein
LIKSENEMKQERDKLGRFLPLRNPNKPQWTDAQLKGAFQAGMNAAYSTVAMSPSRRFEIWLKQHHGIKL